MVEPTTYPATFNFGADVVDHLARTADGPALVWASAEGHVREFTFGEISELTGRLANAMRRRGVGKGDRVIVMLPRIPEWQIAMVACLKLGAVPVPCIEMLTAKDVAYRLRASQATAAIVRSDCVGKFDDEAGSFRVKLSVGKADGWEEFEKLLAEPADNFEPAVVEAEDPAILYFTSGSTGHPKGVLHAARALYLWRESADHWLDLKRDDIMWCTADTGWSKAGTSILFGPWSRGTCCFFYDGPFDPAERLRLLQTHRVSVYCAPSTELLKVLGEDIKKHDLSSLRRIVSAGEALSPVIVERWRQAAGIDIAEAYGQTETLMTVLNMPGMAYKAGSMGVATPSCTIEVIDEAGIPQGPGVVGDLAILTPNGQIMLGYWEDPERTEACYFKAADGRVWFVTGDRAERDEERYLFHRGRRDDVINSAGYRIGPAEVEDALLSHPAVGEVAVVGAPDADRGEIVMAFVVLAPGYVAGEALVKDLQQHARSTTAPYKYPRAIRFVDELPKTVNGKIQRSKLREALKA